MGSISDKLTYLTETKEAIKDKLTEHSIDVSTGDSFRSYADKIEEMRTLYAFEPLPFEIRSINGYSVNYTPYIKIFASDLKSYTAIEWGQLVSNNPNLKETLQPLGFEIRAYGQHFVILNPLDTIPDYIPVPGTDEANNSTTKGGANASKLNRNVSISWGGYTNNSGTWVGYNQYYAIRRGLYSIDIIKNETTTEVNNKLHNEDGTDASINRNGNNLILSTPNAPFTWTIKENCGFRMSSNTPQFLPEPQKDILRLEADYAQTEWMRHRASIVAKDSNDNDITTSLPDGEYADRVDIVTENGEMYFKIIVDENDSTQDILTNNLAKYNIHNFGYDNNINLKANIANQIYNDQKANGVNMNSGLNPNDTLRVLTPGAKGAEAYTFQGKWRIITPILTLCYSNYGTNSQPKERNIPDSPLVYYWRNVIKPKYEAMGIQNIQPINETWGQAYALNRWIIYGFLKFLRSTAGGNYIHKTTDGKGGNMYEVPNTLGTSALCSTRLTRTAYICAHCAHLYTTSAGPQSLLLPAFGFNLQEPITPPTISLNSSNKMVITADSGTTIYYSINNQNYEPMVGFIGNPDISTVKSYTSPVTVSHNDEIRAIAVNSERRCSLPTYMKIQFPAPDPPIIYEGSIFSGQQRTYWMRTTDTSCDIYYTWTNDAVGRNPDLNNLTTSLSEVYNGKTKKFNKSNLNSSEIQTRFGYNTIKAIAVKNGVSSSVTTFTIEITESAGDDWGD